MTTYRKTMREALEEMHDSLDEGKEKLPRQLVDPNKEVMVVKKNKVIVIDKKDQDKYMKQGYSLAEDVELDESVIDKVKEIASKKSAKKIDGVMVDSFTASAISQIYDKVNDANKKKMDSLPIIKLADLAFKMMQKSEFVPEEVELDEMKSKNYALAVKGKFVAVGSKADMRKMKKQKGGEVYMSPGAKVGGSPGKAEDVDLDEKLKFEGKFKVGDIIRSYDFKPMRDRKDNYIQGKIVKAGTMQQGAKVYEIKISNDSGKTSGDRVGDIGYVPMGVSSMEYDGRIVKVSDVKEEVEEGAAADARRAMRNDPDMKQRAFSKDVSSTDDDEKGASKNIMMQLRKAVSLRSYDVEFADGKKQKVDQKIAQAVQNKYNSMRRPADKEKFQAQIAKSYKDMLKTIKSGYGEQKESILEKIERKIKENKNG
jgi:hypothetical protein